MKTSRFIAELRDAGTIDQAARTGSMVVYSGAPVYRYDFWTDTEFMLTLSMKPSEIDLSRMKGAPLLRDHRRYLDAQVGVIESAMISGGKLMAVYKFADVPSVEETWQMMEQGIIRQVSVEAQINQTRDITQKGAAMKSLLAIDWQPQAVALVPVGADPGAVLMAESQKEEFWLSEGMYIPRQHAFAPHGAAVEANRGQMLATLLQNGQ